MKIPNAGKMILLVLGGFLMHSSGFAQDPAGKVTFLKGEAWVQKGVAREALEEGSIVRSGDQLRTGRNANLYLRFRDQTFFALGPEAKMDIDAYNDSGQEESSFVTSVLRGAFRFVSGLLAKDKPERFNVRVTVGTIGVRGTNVAGEVFERVEGEDGVVEASARVVLLEDEEGADSAIEVSNQFGSVIIDQPGFGTEIPDESSPPGPVRRMQIRAINNLMRTIRNLNRRRLP